MKSRPPDKTLNKNRSRGIRASKAKLRAARLAAGLKSQAELVEKIRLQEGLDKPPRSLVSRVFRGEAVDISSIERVAKALNTEAWCLYLDSHESTPEGASEKEYSVELTTAKLPNGLRPQEDSQKGRVKWLFLPTAALLVVALLWLTMRSSLQQESTKSNSESPPGLSFSNKVSVVIPIKGPRGDEITQALQQALSSSSEVPAKGWLLYSGMANPLDLIKEQKADLVFSGETQKIGRHLAVQLFVTEHSTMKQVWAGSVAASVAGVHLRNKLLDWFEAASTSEVLPEYPDWLVLIRFLKGKNYMHESGSADVVLRALNEFESVVRLAPTFTDGHAALCDALTEFSTLTGDKSRLTEAEMHCQRALLLNPNSHDALAATANLQRKKGNNDEAIAGFEYILAQDPNNVTAMRILAETLMRLYFQNNDKLLMERAKSLLDKATTIEPDNWKIVFTLARLHYFAGNSQLAIEKFTKATEIYPSYKTFNNLGTVEFCAGELKKAKTHYQRALHFEPEEASLLSNIATLHYYLGEYEQALAIYEPQLEKLKLEGATKLYQVWSNIADAYHMQGMKKQAIEAYHRALKTLEYEIAKGEGNVQQKSARLAIYLILTDLEPQNNSEVLLASLRQQAEQLRDAQDPVSLYHLAVSWIYLGELDKARELRDKLGSSCPGYAASPTLNVLNQ